MSFILGVHVKISILYLNILCNVLGWWGHFINTFSEQILALEKYGEIILLTFVHNCISNFAKFYADIEASGCFVFKPAFKCSDMFL